MSLGQLKYVAKTLQEFSCISVRGSEMFPGGGELVEVGNPSPFVVGAPLELECVEAGPGALMHPETNRTRTKPALAIMVVARSFRHQGRHQTPGGSNQGPRHAIGGRFQLEDAERISDPSLRRKMNWHGARCRP